MDQVFSIKNMFEKYLEKGKSLYVAFMDLEKTYDRVDRVALLAGAKNIWELVESGSLRKETHEYVPRFMALILIYKYQSEFGLKDQISIPEDIDITEINLKEQVNIHDIARLSDTPVKIIKMLNPELSKLKTPPGKRGYSLKIPESTKSKLLKNDRLYTKFFTLHKQHISS